MTVRSIDGLYVSVVPPLAPTARPRWGGGLAVGLAMARLTMKSEALVKGPRRTGARVQIIQSGSAAPLLGWG